jgi:hypothetical protein
MRGGRLIWSFHVMRARLRAAAPAAAAVAVGVLLGVLVIDPNTPPPGGWAASDYLAAAIGGTLLFACVLSVVAVWPRRGLHVLWWATVALWLRLILPSMPTDVRSGMAVLRVFVFWTALALPLFATAVWRARPHTARGWRRAAVGAALWMAALAFALPYRDIASDIWLPRQPYARLGAIAWVSVAPLPVLLGLVVTKMTGRAQARPAVQRVAELER